MRSSPPGRGGTGEELRLLLKTRAERYAELQAHVRAHHPGADPEISAVPIEQGSPDCLRGLAGAIV